MVAVVDNVGRSQRRPHRFSSHVASANSRFHPEHARAYGLCSYDKDAQPDMIDLAWQQEI